MSEIDVKVYESMYALYAFLAARLLIWEMSLTKFILFLMQGQQSRKVEDFSPFYLYLGLLNQQVIENKLDKKAIKSVYPRVKLFVLIFNWEMLQSVWVLW